jgi:hypothetical protein
MARLARRVALSGILGLRLRVRVAELRDARRAVRRQPVPRWVELPSAPHSREYSFPRVQVLHGQHDLHLFTGAPYVAIDVLGVSPSRFVLLLFFPAVASFSGFLIAARVTGRIGGQRMMRMGAMIAFAGTLAMAALALAGVWHPLALFLPGMAIGFANAIAAPSSTIGAISRDPAIAGAASGLLGFLQRVTAAVSTQVVVRSPFAGRLPWFSGAVPDRCRRQADPEDPLQAEPPVPRPRRNRRGGSTVPKVTRSPSSKRA